MRPATGVLREFRIADSSSSSPSANTFFGSQLMVGTATAQELRAHLPAGPPRSSGTRSPRSAVGCLLRVTHPVAPLASLATVHVRVLAQTAGGAASLDEVYSFVVEDRTAPRVVGAQALAQKTVRVGFDESVLVPSGASFLLTPKGAPAVSVAVAGVNVEGSVVLLTL